MPGLTSIASSFTDKLGERWLAELLTPALVFWAGGALCWASRPDFTWQTWDAAFSFFRSLDGTQGTALAIVGLLVVVVSGAVAERFTLPLLQLLEGYWPGWLDGAARPLRERVEERRLALVAEWQPLQHQVQTNPSTLSARELARCARLFTQIRQIPNAAPYQMPTRIGNILRASERRSADRYGLDANVCWPRLWLVMDDRDRSEIADARTRLNTSTRMLLWSVLFAVWTCWSWLVLPVAAVAAVYSYFLVVDAASGYGLLLESAFDVNRRALYKALGFATPANSSLEVRYGEQLSQFLARGSLDAVFEGNGPGA